MLGLLLSLPGCDFDEIICPPNFCSGCKELENIKIGNVQCYPATAGPPPNSSSWSFNVFVSGSLTGGYSIIDPISSITIASGIYNIPTPIPFSPLRNSCINLIIRDNAVQTCESVFTICPPKPCQPFPNDCNLELIVQDVECVDKDGSYIVTLDIWNVGSDHLCYSTTSGPSPTLNSVPSNGQLGPFSSDVTLRIYSCSGSDCSNCISENCYKVIRVFEPDCDSGHFDSSSPPRISNITDDIVSGDLKVIPNPINQQEVRIVSSLTRSSIEIYNTTATLVHKTEFAGSEYRWNMSHLPSGNYFVKYQDLDGNIRTIKFVKL
ncbi:MAG: T9SS type A sorting domain-containing protein [Saprospiraceae bacterium]|nr:T9SS type A sorting domain-containing protein [Saprospiraceae bacterium]